MKVVSINQKKPEPNIDLIATLTVILEEAKQGKAQAMAIAVQYLDGDAKHVIVSANDDVEINERMLLAEMQIALTDMSFALAYGDPGTSINATLASDEDSW